MSDRRCVASLGFVSIAAVLLWAVATRPAVAQCGGHGDMGGGHDHGAAREHVHAGHSEHPYHLPKGGLPSAARRTPHGGLFLETSSHLLEVVYLPQEARVYFYEKSGAPRTSFGVRGEMSPQVPGESSPRHIPLQHVPPSGPEQQDYLAAATYVSQLPDKTPITFRFENLPERRHPTAEFTPVFSQSQIRPYVVRVSLVQADGEGLAWQQNCPITGARLGSMGSPVKILIGERPLYLCCAGCIDQVKEAEEARLAKRPAHSVAR